MNGEFHGPSTLFSGKDSMYSLDNTLKEATTTSYHISFDAV